jgi:hypothetical protein
MNRNKAAYKNNTVILSDRSKSVAPAFGATVNADRSRRICGSLLHSTVISATYLPGFGRCGMPQNLSHNVLSYPGRNP